MKDSSSQKFYYQDGNNFISLNGINNLSLDKSMSLNEHFMLGGIESSTSINAPQQVEVSFDRSFIKYDELFKFTGSNPISKAFIYNGDRFYGLNNLYLNTYSVGFSVGELPKINTKFTSYGSTIDQNSYPQGNIIEYTNDLDIPKLDSITITGDSSYELKNIYNIFSFDYTLDINRQVFYGVGSESALNVVEILPIKINFSINSKLKNEQNEIDIANIKQNNLNFDISVSGKNQNMIFPIRKAQLMSSSVGLSNLNTLEIKRQYIGYYGI